MKLNIYKILLSWKTQPVLFLSQSNQAAFITIFLITFVGVLIFLSWILRRYDKNKKIIVQAKKQLREVQQVKDQIEKQSKEQSIFYIGFIHDIKIPFLIIQNSFNAYLESKNKSDNTFDRIKNYVDSMIRNIINLLDTEKISLKQILYKHENVINLSKAIKKEVEVFKYITNTKQISLTLASEDSLFIKINPIAFARIINNLLDNAVKYTQKGGEINITLKSDSSYIYLDIKDNGSGIPENQIQKIFKSYHRIKNESLNQGLGIGLFLVKNIVESAKGRIEVKSEVGEGSTFTLIFLKCTPTEIENLADVTPARPIGNNGHELIKESYDIDKSTILLVEDNIDLLKFLQKCLINEYNAYYAKNGQKAIEKLPGIPKPDIIISDIMMDAMNGHEFYNQISENEKYNDIPFIFLTSRTGQEEKLESLKKGVIDYIIKPFSIDELKAKIKTILNKLEKTKEIYHKKMMNKLSRLTKSKGDDKFIFFEKKCKEYRITPREKEVLQLLLIGRQIKEIANELYISFHTVRNHIRHMYEKTGTQNRIELLNIFRE